MADQKNIDQLREQGWKEMANLLDTHLPTEKNKPVAWWYWLAGAAAVLALLVIAWPVFTDSGSSQIATTTSPEYSNHSEIIQSEPSSAPAVTERSNAALPNEELTTTSKEKYSDTAPATGKGDAARTYAAAARSIQNDKNESDRSVKSLPSATDASSAIVPSLIPSQPLRVASPLLTDGPDFFIRAARPSLANIQLDQNPIDVTPHSGRIRIHAFSEMMWSLSDQFGFINAGPGVAYEKENWSLGVSVGVAVPVPNQKTFHNSNLTFSKLYNFSQELSSQNIAYQDATGMHAVYYENYKMKPGFKFDIFTQLRLTPRWNLGLDVGRIGYQWDFSQKAVPNQTVAARVDLTDLKNEIWYGGITAGYEWWDRLQVRAGFRIINPEDPQNLGVLPVVRLRWNLR